MPEKKSTFKAACAPYGAFSAAPILLSVVALILTSVAAFSCTTFILSLVHITSATLNIPFGYTAQQVADSCVPTPLALLDGPMKIGNALGIVATVIGVLQVITVICTTFVVFPKTFFTCLSVVGFVLAVFAVLVASIGLASKSCSKDPMVNPFIGISLDDDDSPEIYMASCRLGPTSYVGFVGCLCWIAAAVTLLIMPRKKRETIDDGNNSLPTTIASGGPEKLDTAAEEPETTVVFINNPDGSCTKTTTTVSTDNGQKLVAKVVEQF